MAKIRLVTFYEAPNCWDVLDDHEDEIDEQLNEYVLKNIKKINMPGFKVEDFNVPDNLTKSNKRLVMDACNGKSFSVWVNNQVDFHNEYYQNWVFTYKDKKWKEFYA